MTSFVQFGFGFKGSQVDQLCLQCIKVSFYGSVVIGTTGFAHALDHAVRLAEFNEFFGCKLASTVRVENNPGFTSAVGYGFGQRIDCKLCIDAIAVYACHDTTVKQIHDAAIVSFAVIGQEQICKVDTPAHIPFFCMKTLV